MTETKQSEDEGYHLKVTSSNGETVFECDLDTFTDVKDKFVFLDTDGEGRLMVSAEELQQMAVKP